MARALDHSDSHASDHLHVRRVELSAPIRWLFMGAHDLRRSLQPSLAVGCVVAAAGIILLGLANGASYLVPALLGGFLLVAPFAAIAVYGLSRQMERGEPIDANDAFMAWRANAGSIALFGLFLTLALIFWERTAAIIFASFYNGQPLHLSRLTSDMFLSGQFAGMGAAFFAAGALLAAIVFALSVVSAPLLLDRPVDVVTAVITSLRCCARNPGTMLLWALLIAAITAVGFVTAMLGLVPIFPWLAHASWRAYRDLIEHGA